MNRYVPLILSVATMGLLAGCDIDDSAPKRPRTSNFLAPNEKAENNAERRSLEQPERKMPTGGSEFPGQSAAPTKQPSIAMLDVEAPEGAAETSDHPTWPGFPISGFTGPSGRAAFGHTTGPQTVYNRDTVTGYLPHMPPNPGSTPRTGATMIPDGEWSIDHSWGQGMAIVDAPHRNWPTMTATYKSANVVINPVYFFNLQEHMAVPQNDGTYCGNVKSVLYEVPWFFINTAALPLLMALEPPLAVRHADLPSQDPVFLGYLPTGGPIFPSAYPGQLQWTYGFLNADGTLKKSTITPTTNPR
jgi:hypothetical protein